MRSNRKGLDMKSFDDRILLACGALLLGIGCTDPVVEPGNTDSGTDGGRILPTDSGSPDGGTDGGRMDSGPPSDSGTNDGATDAGPPSPAYCPMLPTAGAMPTCPALASRPVIDIATAGDMEQTGDLTWTCASTYRLRNTLFMMSGTLTIEAGTHIVGDEGAALVITQGAQILAIGHPSAPIVFTSSAADAAREPGDWGGVVLLGDAPINTTGTVMDEMLPTGVNAIEGLPATDARGRYGGSDATHDCGTMRWVRIEYAGYVFGMGNELNGLTLGGCGSQTDIEMVQVHLGLDDGFEMFGGSPNLSFVIASGYDDDGLDWDFGYTGRIQFAVVDRLGLASVGSGDPNGIEADNHPSAFDNTPRSNPTVFNVTMIGEPAQTAGIGMVLRRGTHGTIRNAIVMNWPQLAINLRDAATISAAGTGLQVTNSIFFMNGASGMQFGHGTGAGRTFDTVFDDAASMNRIDVDPMLGTISDTEPNYVPPTGSPAATMGANPPAGFQTQASFVGAFGPGCPDWSEGWTAFP